MTIWARRAGSAIFILGLLYAFLVGVKGMETAIGAFGADFADQLFSTVSNPFAALFVGILATILIQSSSATTATIVGLVGAGVLPLETAIPMVMGANLGSTTTSTLVSLGHVRQGQEFRRAFAGATVQDFFNLLSVIVFFPLELATGIFQKSATALTGVFRGTEGVAGADSSNFFTEALRWPIGQLNDLLSGLSPTARGIALTVASVALIVLALTMITKVMRSLMGDRIEATLNKFLQKGSGAGGILVGIVVTLIVQSSGITNSIMVPMVAAGLLSIQSSYPVSVGSDVGTTATGLLAAMAVPAPAALTIALVHTIFNLAGVVAFYVIPFGRQIPIRLSLWLADLAQRNKTAIAVYVIGIFFVVPIVGLLLLT